MAMVVSKAIVDLHKGTVGATSMGEGQGATFYFEIACYDGPGEFEDDQLIANADFASVSECPLTPLSHLQEISKKRSPRLSLAELSAAASVNHGVQGDIDDEGLGDGNADDESSGYTSDVQAAPLQSPTPSAMTQRIKRNHLPASSEVITTNNSFATKQQQTSELLLQGKKLKILIADDTALSRKMVERLISTVSTDCTHAINGQDAVSQVLASMQRGQRVFDVVVIDYYMPGLDGPEAIKVMRRCGYTGMIFAVTASAVVMDKEKLLSAGADLIMVKPFDMKVFRDRILGKPM